MTSRDEVLREALGLPADDRAVIASRLLDSLNAGAEPTIAAEWADEIERRISAYDRGEAESIGLEELQARLQRQRKSA